jgi:hypothetical protein
VCTVDATPDKTGRWPRCAWYIWCGVRESGAWWRLGAYERIGMISENVSWNGRGG